MAYKFRKTAIFCGFEWQKFDLFYNESQSHHHCT